MQTWHAGPVAGRTYPMRMIHGQALEDGRVVNVTARAQPVISTNVCIQCAGLADACGEKRRNRSMSPRRLLLVEFDQTEFTVAKQHVNTRIQTMCIYAYDTYPSVQLIEH